MGFEIVLIIGIAVFIVAIIASIKYAGGSVTTSDGRRATRCGSCRNWVNYSSSSLGCPICGQKFRNKY